MIRLSKNKRFWVKAYILGEAHRWTEYAQSKYWMVVLTVSVLGDYLCSWLFEKRMRQLLQRPNAVTIAISESLNISFYLSLCWFSEWQTLRDCILVSSISKEKLWKTVSLSKSDFHLNVFYPEKMLTKRRKKRTVDNLDSNRCIL